MTTQETFEVQLAIYDLSRGMARSLSAQFLGQQFAIDAIPHTGLIVYGREYFYGAGIQSEDPQQFRQYSGMFPFQVQSLGRTTVNRSQFEQWCRDAMQNGRYNAASYDLLNQNCNNFCHDAALQGLRLDKGVPDWILQVPQRFLSSPMGQMVRPMLENMQVLNVTGAEPVAPFANAANSLPLSTSSNSASNSAGTSTQTSMAANNPWANIPSSSNTCSASQSTPVLQTEQKTTQTTTPLLDSFAKPLLSTDTNMVPVCIAKLLAASTTEEPVNENERDALQKAGDVLTKSDNDAYLDEPLAETTCQVILESLKTGSNVTFALLLLRIVVLQASKDSTEQCLNWLQAQLTEMGDGESSSSHSLSSAASRSAAWLTVSNAAGVSLSRLASVEAFVEAAVIDISLDDSHQQQPPSRPPSPQVRQAACALLYNVVLGKTVHVDEDLPDMLVSILCACLEDIDVETDDTARLRRLMVVGRIVKPSCTVNPSSKGLVLDLGYKDGLEQLSRSPESSGNAEKCRKLALELTGILSC